MSITLEVGKKYSTRDGKGVGHVLSDEYPDGDFPLVVVVNHPSAESSSLFAYSKAGRLFGEAGKHFFDLVSVHKEPLKRDVWVNVYQMANGLLFAGGCHPSRKLADNGESNGRVGCIKVTLEERYDD